MGNSCHCLFNNDNKQNETSNSNYGSKMDSSSKTLLILILVIEEIEAKMKPLHNDEKVEKLR